MKQFLKKWTSIIKKLPLGLIGCLFLIVVCAVSFAVISVNPSKAIPASALTASFSGEYKVADGEWIPITENEHISSVQGEVTLRGKFIVLLPNGEFLTDNPQGFSINFYCNHVSVKVRVGDETVLFDTEHPLIGADACGAMWSQYYFPEGTDGTVEIVISNPHKHGNERAVNELLESIRMDDPLLLGDSLAKTYDTSRYVGFSFVALALVVLVLTVVACIAKLKIASFLWIIAFWVFFTGGIYIFDVADVFFWNENLPANTAMLSLCQILSGFFLSLFASKCLTGKSRRVGAISQTVVGGIVLLAILLATCGVVRIFDVRFYCYLAYAAQLLLLCVLGVRELPKSGKGIRIVFISSLICMACVLIEFFAGKQAIGLVIDLSKIVYAAMLIIVMAFGIHAIISNYKASMRTKEMENELKDKSIAVMISQIQPHFLYNSLNTIAELCVVDPERAEKATINFSRYLRGNMGALNEKNPIEFEDELSHLKHYIELEKLRYGNDLQFEYDIKDTDFTLPALTVQPLVENAVNHGIRYHKMKGKVKISSYSDEDNFYVAIEDDGVGFDPERYMSDGGKHVGISNVKYRLAVLCGGSVDIKSEIGKGSVVTIRIPKEKQV